MNVSEIERHEGITMPDDSTATPVKVGSPGPDVISTVQVVTPTTMQPQTKAETKFLAQTKDYAVMPNIHFVMVVATIIIAMVGMILYNFAPASKEGLYLMVTSTAIGALFGKLTNGFGRPFRPLPGTLPATEDTNGDGIPDAEQ